MLILASGSPRRKQLLSYLPYPFEVIPSNIEEHLDSYENPIDYARQLAELKAKDVAEKNPSRWVLGCDTIVEKEGTILGKPENEQEAKKMLLFLSNSHHQVITAFSLIKCSGISPICT
jgi:septum formation protein